MVYNPVHFFYGGSWWVNTQNVKMFYAEGYTVPPSLSTLQMSYFLFEYLFSPLHCGIVITLLLEHLLLQTGHQTMQGAMPTHM